MQAFHYHKMKNDITNRNRQKIQIERNTIPWRRSISKEDTDKSSIEIKIKFTVAAIDYGDDISFFFVSKKKKYFTSGASKIEMHMKGKCYNVA